MFCCLLVYCLQCWETLLLYSLEVCLFAGGWIVSLQFSRCLLVLSYLLSVRVMIRWAFVIACLLFAVC